MQVSQEKKLRSEGKDTDYCSSKKGHSSVFGFYQEKWEFDLFAFTCMLQTTVECYTIKIVTLIYEISRFDWTVSPSCEGVKVL